MGFELKKLEEISLSKGWQVKTVVGNFNLCSVNVYINPHFEVIFLAVVLILMHRTVHLLFSPFSRQSIITLLTDTTSLNFFVGWMGGEPVFLHCLL